jgi:hypothetical protein
MGVLFVAWLGILALTVVLLTMRSCRTPTAPVPDDPAPFLG